MGSSSQFCSSLEENPHMLPLIPKTDKDGESKGGSKSCNFLIIVFVFVIGLGVLLFWLIVKPRWPIFTIEEGSIIEGYDLTSSNHLNAAFNYTVRVSNPNSKLTFHYEYLEIKAYHGGHQLVGYAGVYDFLQPHANATLFSFGGEARDMALFASPGEVDLRVEIKGRMWYKAGSWKLHRYKVKSECFPVVVYLDSQSGF